MKEEFRYKCHKCLIPIVDEYYYLECLTELKLQKQKQKLEPKQEPNQELTVQDFIKRLAEAGITIDLKSIMNTKKEKDK